MLSDDSRFVLDASVAVEWFLPDRRSAEAMKLLRVVHARGAFALSPDLLLVEVAAVVGKRARQGKVAGDYARQVLNVLRRMPLVLSRSVALVDQAAELSQHYRHPLYDCLYLALAREHDVCLATFDRGLAGIAGREGRLWNPA